MGADFSAPRPRRAAFFYAYQHLAYQPGGFGPRRNLDTEPIQLSPLSYIPKVHRACN
jgi:hypothetical protein